MSDGVGSLDHLLGVFEQFEEGRPEWSAVARLRGGPTVASNRPDRDRPGGWGLLSGTGILTPAGTRSVDALRPGDLVMTCDNGFVPVVRVRRRPAPALATLMALAVDAHEAVTVVGSQLVLVQSGMAQMCFGETEVLVPARTLINGDSICPSPPGARDVWQLETARQEVIFANGVRLATVAADRGVVSARMVLTQAEGMILRGARWAV